MASIATVVTMGFGSFGSANLLPTLGYGISAPTPLHVSQTLWFRETGRTRTLSDPGRSKWFRETGRVRDAD